MTFIRPLLEYGDVVWDCKTVYLTNKLESVQAEAATVVTRENPPGIHFKVISRNRVGIFERQKGKTYFYKMNNGLTPGYLIILVPNTLRIFTITIQDIQR